MLKSDLKKRVKELIKKSLSAKNIDAMTDKIIRSGCLDIESEETTYRLPKQIVCAISKQLYADYAPMYDDKKQKKKLKIYTGIYNCLVLS